MAIEVLKRALIMLGLLLAAAVAYSFPDLYEQSSERLHGWVGNGLAPMEAELEDVLRQQKRAGTTAASAKRGARSGKAIELSDVQLEGWAAGTAIVSIRLHSAGTVATYPHLTVEMCNEDGRPMRSLDVPPEAYQHGRSLSDERIRLQVKVQPGEHIIQARLADSSPNATIAAEGT